MENGNVLDNQLIAESSQNNGQTGPDRGRLNMQSQGSKSGGWVAGSSGTDQWLTVRFGDDNTVIVTGVATQGRQDEDQWVTKYRLQYRPHGSSGLLPYYREPGENTSKVANTIVILQ